VGAQSYWNAEATMLMHTRGILVMTPQAAMVLTGKRALDYSGSVSGEDNQAIGGVESIMGPNGQCQYTARNISHACLILFHHYELTYTLMGETFPRRARTTDPVSRSILDCPHKVEGGSFSKVGEIFSNETNAGRKKPFDIRSVLHAVIDQDHAPLERWSSMRHAENAVVLDAYIGGYSVCLLGIESRPLTRQGFVPGDGPENWSGGTLFPLSAKKLARAINGASNNRPVVILANLAGFDGSPESMRKLQLEYGAEIGRAVVNFKGPMVFCVISRYHGGAYVVFSKTLNEQLESAALEGSFASVIGGAPAAAVIFPGDVKSRTYADERIKSLKSKIASAGEEEKLVLYTQLNNLLVSVQVEKQKEVAEEFDQVHNVERAKRVGSLDKVVAPDTLRSYLIDAIERGMTRYQSRQPAFISESQSS